MEILNLTPTDIVLVSAEGNEVSYPSRGIATVDEDLHLLRVVDGIPVNRRRFGYVKGLPEPDVDQNKLYIVDQNVADAVGATRLDLLLAAEPIDEAAGKYRSLLNA
jgi:hypothetical protein